MSVRRCFLAQFSERPCEGRLVRAHLVRQQVIQRELLDARGQVNELLGAQGKGRLPRSHDLRWDSRTWVWACGGPTGNGGHHGMLDHSRTLRVPRAALPEDVEEFAAEFGLGWWLDREYGEATA